MENDWELTEEARLNINVFTNKIIEKCSDDIIFENLVFIEDKDEFPYLFMGNLAFYFNENKVSDETIIKICKIYNYYIELYENTKYMIENIFVVGFAEALDERVFQVFRKLSTGEAKTALKSYEIYMLMLSINNMPENLFDTEIGHSEYANRLKNINNNEDIRQFVEYINNKGLNLNKINTMLLKGKIKRIVRRYV